MRTGSSKPKRTSSTPSRRPPEVQAAREDPENHWIPEYGPDEAGLTVFHAFGRRFTVWRAREEPEDAPKEQRWTVLRIVTNPDGPLGLDFPEV
jgi:hypothetical protein